MPSVRYVSRGGDKLAAALDHFGINPQGQVCADLGSHVGGFVDCLLQRGATRVYAVDTAYGTFAWKLRRDPAVSVIERTNAMHVTLPEPVDLVTVDTGWTPQEKILPNVARLLAAVKEEDTPPSHASPPPLSQITQRALVEKTVITLIKPHYEATTHAPFAAQPRKDGATRGSRRFLKRGKSPLVDGALPDSEVDKVVEQVLAQMAGAGWSVGGTFTSPLRGHGGNREVFALLTRSAPNP